MTAEKGRIVAEHAVVFERIFQSAPETVWAFLTDLKRLPEWYGDGAFEPREGGAVSLMGGHIRGVVTGWRPQEFLAYTWNVFQPGETVSRWPISYLEFALAADGAATRLTLTHRPIPDAMQSLTAMGWHTMLDLVAAGLAGRFPTRADLFATNAALYGVDTTNIKR